jgi:hypothetical protein
MIFGCADRLGQGIRPLDFGFNVPTSSPKAELQPS